MKKIKKVGKCSDKDCALKLIETGQKAKICNNCSVGLLEQLQAKKKQNS